MTKKEIDEYNKEICRFMNPDKYEFIEHNSRFIEKFKYHTSYDWIMPVVEKIHEEESEDTQAFAGLEIFEIGLTAGLETIYKSVVAYIKWKNNNNE